MHSAKLSKQVCRICYTAFLLLVCFWPATLSVSNNSFGFSTISNMCRMHAHPSVQTNCEFYSEFWNLFVLHRNKKKKQTPSVNGQNLASQLASFYSPLLTANSACVTRRFATNTSLIGIRSDANNVPKLELS